MFSLPVLIARGLDLQYAGLPLHLLFSVQFSGCVSESVGVFNDEGPPVPIPNTEVKLTGVDNTWLATAREDRLLPDYISPFTSKRGGTFHLVLYYFACRKKTDKKM